MNVVYSLGDRQHFPTDCWCRPETCDHCSAERHRDVQLSRDVQCRMAVFSDQRVSART